MVACSTQLLISGWPLSHSRTPSLDVVKKVYVPVIGAASFPLQRTEKLSSCTPGPGDAVQLKSIDASVRDSPSVLKYVPAPLSLKYSARNPVPEPAGGLTDTDTSS